MAEITTPFPARFWWLKRLTAAGLLLFVILMALRLWWGFFAQRKLNAEITAAQSRGEPTLMDDFNNSSSLPSDQNATTQLLAAIAAINFNPAQQNFDNRFNPDNALSDDDSKLLHGLILANANAIKLARAAADLPQADWGIKLKTPVLNTMLPDLSGQRNLANLLHYAAIDHHSHNDDEQTVGDLRDIFRESDAVENYGPFIVTHLVAVGISSLGSYAVDAVAANLNIGPSGASPVAVQRLMDQLIDDRQYRQAAERSLYSERLIAIDASGTLPLFPAPPKPTVLWLVQPMLTLDTLRVFRFETAVAHAMREPTYSIAIAKSPPALVYNSNPLFRVAANIYSMMLIPSVNRLIVTHYRGLTDRRAAAVLLAIRLYEVQHGAPPTNLDLLVPNYLSAVPIDPFSPDGHVMRYINTPGAQAVYSVGEDSHDDGGSTQFTATHERRDS